MLKLDRVKQDERLLRALIGLNLKAFNELKPAFAEAILEAPMPRRSKGPRQREAGAGRKPRLASVEDKLLYVLFYFKCYPTFDLAGLLFDLNRSQANRWLHRLQPVLETALGKKMALPKRKIRSLEEFMECFPEVKRVIPGGTERPIQRSVDQEKQKQDYSGKKKRHTRTHLGAVTPDKRILVFTQAYPTPVLVKEMFSSWITRKHANPLTRFSYWARQNQAFSLSRTHVTQANVMTRVFSMMRSGYSTSLIR